MVGNIGFEIAAFTLVFGAFAYACIFADPETSDLAVLCTKKIPSFIFTQLGRLIGAKQLSRLEKLMDRGLQIVYLVVVLGSWSIIFTFGYDAIENSNYVSSNHKYAGYVVFTMCMSSWHFACSKGAGSITVETIPLFDHYEYDNLLYTDRQCPTLKFRKLARSKYDRFSKRHVPRFDHFCGWLNQAVGEQNYRWFLLFLTIHVFMCAYGTWAMALVLYGEILEKNLFNATFFNAVTGAEVKADYIVIFNYMFMRYFEIGAVLLLMAVMTVCLGIFLAFHLYISSRNMTTNEFFKWKAVRKWHKKERQRYIQAMKDGKIERRLQGDETNLQVNQPNPDVDVGCTGPIETAATSKEIEENDFFDPGPMPINIYNKGIFSNFIEVFKPLSFRREARMRYRISLNNDGAHQYQSQFSEVRKSKPKAI